MTRYRWPILLFVIALSVRIAFILFVPVDPLAGGDQQAYLEMANAILVSGTPSSFEGVAFRSPLYSYAIAPLVGIGSHLPDSIFFLQAIIGALSVVFLFGVLEPLSRQIAIIAALLTALHPMLLLYTKQVLTENLYTFLVLVLVSVWVTFPPVKFRSAILCGFCLGLAILCRSEALVLGCLLLVGTLIWMITQQRQPFLSLALVVLITGIVLGPWIFRNYSLIGAPTLATEGGVTFYFGNNPEATGGYHVPNMPKDAPLAEAQRSGFFYKEGLDFIQTQPMLAASIVVNKLLWLWSSQGNQVLDLADMILLPIAFFGLLAAVGNKILPRYIAYFLLCPLLSIHIVSALFIGQSRFRAPLYPFLMIFAAVGLIYIWNGMKVFLQEKAGFSAY